MKIDKQFPETVRNLSGKYFLNFYFWYVDISLIMHDPHMKLNTCIENIAVKDTVSQTFYIGPGSLSIKSKSINSNIFIKSNPFFVICDFQVQHWLRYE